MCAVIPFLFYDKLAVLYDVDECVYSPEECRRRLHSSVH